MAKKLHLLQRESCGQVCYPFLIPVKFDGCAVGVKTVGGVPMKKPWTIKTNCTVFTTTWIGEFVHVLFIMEEETSLLVFWAMVPGCRDSFRTPSPHQWRSEGDALIFGVNRSVGGFIGMAFCSG